MAYKLIVILGPDSAGGEGFFDSPSNALHRAYLESEGVKFIGDGKSTVDYEGEIRQLPAGLA